MTLAAVLVDFPLMVAKYGILQCNLDIFIINQQDKINKNLSIEG